MGVTFANIICRIFALLKQHWLWIVAVNAFGMTLDISLWLKIVKMPYCVWPEEHKPTANSPNLETIIENNPEDNGNDEKFFCGRDIKTKQGCSIQKRNCDEAYCKMGRFGFFGYFGGTKMALRVPESKF